MSSRPSFTAEAAVRRPRFTRPDRSFPLTRYCSFVALSMQKRGRSDQNQEKQRHDDGRDYPVGQAKLGQHTLLFSGGSASYPQSPVEAVGSAVMKDRTLAAR